jgi:tetratricopeptide (TPR) repeat protein
VLTREGHSQMRLFVSIVANTALAATLAAMPAEAQERTGTRLDSRAARPAVLHLNQSSEIDAIRRLIQNGEHQAAVQLAQATVENARARSSLDAARISETVLYDALNAFCVALTTSGRTDEALEACSEAIDAEPRRWSAWNSRGTTYFVRENYEAAYSDFARAFELAPDHEDLVDTLEWNLKLARDRIAEFE